MIRTSLSLKFGVIAAKTLPLTAALMLSACSAFSEANLVKDQDAFKEAVENAGPGDVITLANGTWEDFEILFTGQGEEGKPITLTAETKGKVILTGQSNLRLGGEYLEVSGLVFKDGYTPTKEVISFGRTKKTSPIILVSQKSLSTTTINLNAMRSISG